MKLLILVSLLNFQSSIAIWWWLFKDSQNDNSAEKETTVSSTVGRMLAPFEISHGEQSFLAEAKNYLQNLPILDQCNLLIINRLKTSCNKLSDQELSKLGVNLLNCQSVVEGRAVFKCTENMNIADCTKNMDSDTWNSYHIISNRARAICYSVRQAQFRMETEKTVNNLASATLENVNLLNNLASGQRQLQRAADDAIHSMTENQNAIIEKQDYVKKQQANIGSMLSNNVQLVLHEKNIIKQRHQQVEQYTQLINTQLATLMEEIKTQELAKKKNEKEILKDLDSVKMKADEVLKKLDDAFVDMDHYHGNIERKQNITLENLKEIQEAISFMADVLNNLYASVHDQMPWLHEMFGGTIDKLTIITTILGHVVFFLTSLCAVIFINAPNVTRILMLIVVPLNCLTALQRMKNLNYMHMAWILVATVPLNFVLTLLFRCVQNFSTNKNIVKYDDCFSSPPEVERIKAVQEMTKPFQDTNTVQSDTAKPISPILGCNLTNSSPIKMTCENTENHLLSAPSENSFSLKCNLANNNSLFRGFSTPPLKKRTQDVNTSLGLNTTPGGSLKCVAHTRAGTRCKNSAIGLHETCRVHTPQK